MKIFDPKLTGSIEILNEITGDVTMSANLLVEGNLSGNITGSASTASYIELSNVDGSASLASRIFDNSSSIASLEAVSGSYANSASFASSISANSASIASLEKVSGSYANSASFASNISANSASIGSLNAVSSSYLLNTTDTLTGDLTVTGNIIATTLNVQDVTASVVYSSGSNVFGSSSIDTQQFTGSILTTGSIEVTGPITSGAIVSSASITAAGNSNSFGNTTIGALSASTGTFSASVTAAGNSNSFGNTTFGGSITITGGTTNGLNITTSGTQDTIKINRAATSDNAITKYQTASADKWIVGLRNTGDDKFRFYSYGTSTDVLTIDQSNGNVGIGVTDPDYTLHLLKSSGDTEMYINGQNGQSSLRMGLDARNWQIKTAAAPYLWSLNYVGTDVPLSNIITATVGGNVGIGTDVPDVKLHVYNGDSGATTVGNASDELILENNTDCGLTIRSGTSSDGIISFADSGDHNIGQVYYSHGSNSMTFRTNDSTALTIDSDQNVRTYAKLGIRVDGDAIPWRGTAEIPAVINLAGNGALFTRPDNTFLSQNFYYNASDVGAVIDTGKASLIQLTSGNIIFSNTTSGGSSNATISIVERMRISDDLITFPTVTELRGDIASNKFAIGNMGDASSQMMVSSRGFLTLNVSNTGSAKDATERMRIDSSGNVGIGTAGNPDNILHIETSNAGGPQIQLESTSGTASAAFINFDSTSLQLSTQRDMVDGDWYDTSKSWGGISIQGPAGGSLITFHTAAASNTSPTERMRITSGGLLFVGDTSTNYGYSAHHIANNASQGYALIVRNSNTSTENNSVIQLNQATTGTSGYFMICRQGDPNSGTNRLFIYSNGNVQNVNNSYGQISDERKKENIIDASPKLNDLMKVKVKNFNFKGDDLKQIGVVAQELEEVFPGMISESKDPDSEDETLYKSVKYSVFVPMLIKAIQELKSDNDSLKARIETLENN